MTKETFHFGSQARLAKKLSIGPDLLNHYLTGKNNASAPRANKLAVETDTDIRVWLMGGSPEARRAAVKNWEQKNSALQITDDL
jgi:transcriptional regulator with XRE-family HTH domain